MQRSKKNSSQKKEKRLTRASEVEHFFKLGHCAGKYAESLANPFSGPADACMPVTPACMTRKMRTFIRNKAVVGTQGAGFAAMQPFAANDGSGAAGQVATCAAYASIAAYAGTSATGLPVLDPATAGVAPFNHNGDYATANFGPTGVQARLISMGMRLRYAGTELNRGGRVILFEDPEHSDYGVGGLSLSNLLSNEKAKEHKVGIDWITLCQTGPTLPQEYDFLTNPYTPYGSAGKAFYMVALIESTAGNVFDVEFFWNWEVTGRLARGKTPSEADDMGVGVVLGAIKSVNDNQLDSKHPLVKTVAAAGSLSPQTQQAISSLVQKYAEKNTSGWVSKVKSGFNAAKPYLKDAAQLGAAALPYLASLL